MDIQQAVAASPVRILEKMMGGGLGSGNLGVIMSRAGVGKTAFLIQIGLDAAVRQKNVLHIALGQTTEHVQSWYDALLKDLTLRIGNGISETMQAGIAKHRVIQSFADKTLDAARLEHIIELYRENMQFIPDLIIIDGYNWELRSTVATAADLGAFKSSAWRLEAELWVSARTHRSETKDHPLALTPPCNTFDELIDIAFFLEPEGDEVDVRPLKSPSGEKSGDPPLRLHCDTFSLVAGAQPAEVKTPPSAHTLLSGGAPGAEELFGQCAEEWGLQETNYTFDGHQPARTRGLVRLSDTELEQGHVSEVYLNATMHRTYPDTPVIKKVLQSIWHQVNTAGEVFVVGTINPDLTVRGGTGWAAKLGRHWRKKVFVYDQEKDAWHQWRNGTWIEEAAPVITATRFTGSGTREVTDKGREAVRNLFKRSFGEPSR